MEKNDYIQRASYYIILQNIAKSFAKNKYTTEQIVKRLEDLNDRTRFCIRMLAAINGDLETADRIKEANNIIDANKIIKFKDAIKNGNVEDYLSRMPLEDKVSLEINLGLISALSNGEHMTDEKRNYLNILEKSMYNDLNHLATLGGFDSIERWQEHIQSLTIGADTSSLIMFDEIDHSDSQLKR